MKIYPDFTIRKEELYEIFAQAKKMDISEGMSNHVNGTGREKLFRGIYFHVTAQGLCYKDGYL